MFSTPAPGLTGRWRGGGRNQIVTKAAKFRYSSGAVLPESNWTQAWPITQLWKAQANERHHKNLSVVSGEENLRGAERVGDKSEEDALVSDIVRAETERSSPLGLTADS